MDASITDYERLDTAIQSEETEVEFGQHGLFSSNIIPFPLARAEVRGPIRSFIETAAQWSRNPFGPAPVHAVRIDTGGGNSEAATRHIAEYRRTGPRDCPLVRLPWIYAVPRHQLGEERLKRFRTYGLKARVFRGRAAANPDAPGEKMCGRPTAVEVAQKLGETIETACCQGFRPDGKYERCPSYNICPYQGQKDDKPDVWIVAHEVLSNPQSAFGEVAGVVIDESFWRLAIGKASNGLTISELRQEPTHLGNPEEVEFLTRMRRKLADVFEGQVRQHGLGGVRFDHLVAEGLVPLPRLDEVPPYAELVALELRSPWHGLVWPGMSDKELDAVARKNPHRAQLAAIWRELEGYLEEPEGDVSGRIFLDQVATEFGTMTVVRVRPLLQVAEQFAGKPTLIMDATLPHLDLIRPLYPNVELTADVRLPTPHARIRHVLESPTSARKLTGKNASPRNFRDVYRYALKLWLEHDHQPGLIICQKDVEAELRKALLPENVAVAHYNDISGLDRYKDVRWSLLVGRTLPKTIDVEAKAGVITGVECQKAEIGPNGSASYRRVKRSIRVAGGEDVDVDCWEHPDPIAEAIRWQICEAEVIKAMGRVRAVNRTPEHPVNIDILAADVVLPNKVDEVVKWKDVVPGRWPEMAIEGVFLTSPTDMHHLFPALWPNVDAAKSELRKLGGISGAKSLIEDIDKRNAPEIGWIEVRYRPQGRGQQARTAWFDKRAIQVPKTWLETKLGRLEDYQEG